MDIAPNQRVAVFLMLTASALIALTTLLAKALGTDALGPPLHPLQVSHGRFIFALLALGMAASVLRPRLAAPRWRLHLARTTCGWIGVTLMFAASARSALSDATASSFLNPVFAMLLAIPLLGERGGPIRWSAAGIALVGALILLRPGPGTFQPAALIALASAAVIGFEIILIKRLSGLENPFQVLLINNSLGAVIATCAVIFVWQAPTPGQWAGLAALGICMACAQACLVNAMARAEASYATVPPHGRPA